MQPDLVDHLGAPLTSGFVGAGMVVYLALCVAGAGRLAGWVKLARGLVKIGLVLLQYAFALVASLGVTLPWLYLLGHTRISFIEVLTLLLGCTVATLFLRAAGVLRRRASA